MRTKLFTAFLAIAFVATLPGRALAAPEDSGTAMMVDVVIARPLCLAATAIGSAFFVLSLPIALPTKSVNRSAQALVVTPAKATFTRPLGDFEALKE
jgi:hypothetical protein